MTLPRRVEYFVGRQQECMILPLWKQGKDTLTIATLLALPEYEISNRLPKLLHQHAMERKS
jgi:hypothetical protein